MAADFSYLDRNVGEIRARMDAARARAGRTDEVDLIVAAKSGTPEELNYLFEHCGVRDIGENRVQQLLEHYEQIPREMNIHFIGHLQTNKVKQVVGHVDLIQSVDRFPLLDAIEKEAAKKGVTQNVLLEINIGREESKSGFYAEEVMSVLEKMGNYPHVFVRGLMAIPPISTFPGGNFEFFEKIYALCVDIRSKKYDNVSVECLSMGMSDDFADAIACGSTMVRIGTAIFGARNYGNTHQ